MYYNWLYEESNILYLLLHPNQIYNIGLYARIGRFNVSRTERHLKYSWWGWMLGLAGLGGARPDLMGGGRWAGR